MSESVYQWMHVHKNKEDISSKDYYQLVSERVTLHWMKIYPSNYTLVKVPPLDWLEYERKQIEEKIRVYKRYIMHLEDAQESYII